MNDEYKKKIEYLMYFAEKLLKQFDSHFDFLPDDFETWLSWNSDEKESDDA